MTIANVALTDTFQQWVSKTNQVITEFNVISPTTNTLDVESLDVVTIAALTVNGVAVGQGSISGYNNTAVGNNAGFGMLTGSSNTFIGHEAGSTLIDGANNTLLGNAAQPSSTTVSNEVTIGNGDVTKVRMGNGDIVYPPIDSYSKVEVDIKLDALSAEVDGKFDALDVIPAGLISIWSGAIVNIPEDWALCDGTGGTPDLRDKFVLGAGTSYNVAATGGSADATVVSHTHTPTTTVTDPGHNHTLTSYMIPGASGSGAGNSHTYIDAKLSTTETTGITVNTTISTTGTTGTNANLPPYYALAYIMKLPK